MPTRYKLCDEDQREYGGPEWVTFDTGRIARARASELEALERGLGVPITRLGAAMEGDGTAWGLRALVWVARHQAGLRTSFAEFDIRTLEVSVEKLPETDAEQADLAPLDDSPAGSGTPA